MSNQTLVPDPDRARPAQIACATGWATSLPHVREPGVRLLRQFGIAVCGDTLLAHMRERGDSGSTCR